MTQFVCKLRDKSFKFSYFMIRQCLLHKNESVIISFSQIFLIKGWPVPVTWASAQFDDAGMAQPGSCRLFSPQSFHCFQQICLDSRALPLPDERERGSIHSLQRSSRNWPGAGTVHGSGLRRGGHRSPTPPPPCTAGYYGRVQPCAERVSCPLVAASRHGLPVAQPPRPYPPGRLALLITHDRLTHLQLGTVHML